MNTLKKIGCTVMAILTVSTYAVTAGVSDYPIVNNFSIVNVIEASAETEANTIRLYNQFDEKKWLNNKYNLYNSGCGIFSFCNAIYALNGHKPNPNAVAKFAQKKNVYDTYRGILDRNLLYKNYEKKFGKDYEFKVSKIKEANVSDKTLIKALKKKNKVAVAHVYNHYIAIVNCRYNKKKKNYDYLVIESAEANNRNFKPVEWVNANRLNNANNRDTYVNWFVILESTKEEDKTTEQSERRTLKTKYFPKCTNSCKSIIRGLNGVGACSFFNYRKKIAKANGIDEYVGKAYQDNRMLYLLKKGKLKDPAWKK